MQGRWINASKSKTAVVFVHGVLSKQETSWRARSGAYWPELLSKTPAVSEVGVYVFTYRTGFFSRSYRLGDVVDALKEHMRLDGVFKCSSIIFVAHSMGGIVVRKLITESSNDFVDQHISVGLFLVASPSLGSEYANFLRPLAELVGHKQADALRFSQENSWLMDLDKEFKNLQASGRMKLSGKELMEDKFILGNILNKQVVEPFSAGRYFGESYKVPDSDHFTIAAPEDADAVQHRQLIQFIEDLLHDQSKPLQLYLVPGYSTLSSRIVSLLSQTAAGQSATFIEEDPVRLEYGLQRLFTDTKRHLFLIELLDRLVAHEIVSLIINARSYGRMLTRKPIFVFLAEEAQSKLWCELLPPQKAGAIRRYMHVDPNKLVDAVSGKELIAKVEKEWATRPQSSANLL